MAKTDMIKLNFINESREMMKQEIFEKIFKNFLKVMAKKIQKISKNSGNAEISLIITTNSKIRKLNKKYRKIDKPTDVLSFAYLCDVIGEIFISADKARLQAKKHGHSLQKECEILFVHGLLHLLSFTHDTDKEEREMEKWSHKIL